MGCRKSGREGWECMGGLNEYQNLCNVKHKREGDKLARLANHLNKVVHYGPSHFPILSRCCGLYWHSCALTASTPIPNVVKALNLAVESIPCNNLFATFLILYHTLHSLKLFQVVLCHFIPLYSSSSFDHLRGHRGRKSYGRTSTTRYYPVKFGSFP